MRPIPFRPSTQLAKRNRACVNQLHHRGALAPCLPIGRCRKHREGFGKYLRRPPRARIRQCRASDLARTQMVMLMCVGVEGRFQPPQTVDVAQLREDQRHQMIPALKALVVGVPVVTVHNGRKPPPINRFEQTSKGAIHVAHARSLSVSRQPEGTDLHRFGRACTATQ